MAGHDHRLQSPSQHQSQGCKRVQWCQSQRRKEWPAATAHSAERHRQTANTYLGGDACGAALRAHQSEGRARLLRRSVPITVCAPLSRCNETRTAAHSRSAATTTSVSTPVVDDNDALAAHVPAASLAPCRSSHRCSASSLPVPGSRRVPSSQCADQKRRAPLGVDHTAGLAPSLCSCA